VTASDLSLQFRALTEPFLLLRGPPGLFHPGRMEQLAEANLITIPNFESRWIDAPIELQLRTAVREGGPATADLMNDLPTSPLSAEPTQKGPHGYGLDRASSLEAIDDGG
jgi:hypothetical protein